MKPLIIVLLGITVASTHAQQTSPKIHLTGMSTGSVIKLRWAPDNPSLWHFSLKHGYSIERIAISVNGRIVSPVKTKLWTLPIVPASEKLWEEFIDDDDYVAVAAQTIFGEPYPGQSGVSHYLDMINRSRDLESRYSFALFAADHSVKAAELSGLFFEDATASGGTRYLYKVYSNIPSSVMEVDTAYFLIGLDDSRPLPAIRDLRANAVGHKVSLNWDSRYTVGSYNSFIVERSDDSMKSFVPINNLPFVSTTSDQDTMGRVYKNDSIGVEDKTYFYRVCGITTFAEKGPYSDTVSVRMIAPVSAPVVRSVSGRDGRLGIEWIFDSVEEGSIRHFQIHEHTPLKKQTRLVRDSVSSKFRKTEIPINHSAYVMVTAMTKSGRAIHSLPYFVEMPDSIPPLPPDSLTGRIDFNGRVYLNWQHADTADVLGYHIYRSSDTLDFICTSDRILPDPVFTDSIALNTEEEKIYFRVVAVDRSFNSSPYSSLLELERPDIVPPVPATFYSVNYDSAGAILKWHGSASNDVGDYVLYSRAEGDSTWMLQKILAGTDSVCIVTGSEGDTYYTLVTRDDSGLESEPSAPVVVRFMPARPAEVTEMFSVLDSKERLIGLFWDYEPADTVHFLLYKSVNNSPPQLYQRLTSADRTFKDQFDRKDKVISYTLSVVDIRSGQRSKFSSPIIVRP